MKTSIKSIRLLITIIVITLQFNIAKAQTATPPAIGDGSSGNPYQIATLDNLYWLSQNSTEWTKHYIQTADIDATSTNTWDSGAGFLPIGTQTNPFTGTYNGQHYTIFKLYINRPTVNFIGMFGNVSTTNAKIHNLGLDSVIIVGNSFTGSLVGNNQEYATIDSCYSSGSITCSVSPFGFAVGGMVGRNISYGIIMNSHTSCTTTGLDEVGGFVGTNHINSQITNCYATGNVYSSAYAEVGGFVGFNLNSSTINQCYCTGNVSGVMYVGGFAGYLYGSAIINNSYSFGDVTRISGSDNYIGGFIGNFNNATAHHCYSLGEVFYSGATDPTDKGFAGVATTVTTTECFWNTETSNQSSSATGTGKTTAEMHDLCMYLNAGWDFQVEYTNGTNDYWAMDSLTNNGYPTLWWQEEPHTAYCCNYASLTKDTIEVCDSFIVPSGDETHYLSGIYYDTIPNSCAADSIFEIHLTVNYSTTGDTTATACDSLVWYGTPYYTTGDYPHVISNVAGCDSTITLHLTVNNSSTGDTSATVCDSLVWYGTPYYATGDYPHVISNVAGCDSTITLHLTVNNSSTGDTSATVCDSLVWYGTPYYTTGDYPHVISNVAGCDSTITLHLTVNNSSTGDTSATVCDSLVWYGMPYYATGDYPHVISNVAGCDSTITLHLTVNNSSTGDTSATVCDSLVWYGTPYYTTGNYPHVISNVAGCDSTITLHLTVNNSSTGDTSATVCDSLVWYGTPYYTSGDYPHVISNVAGCDSTITLHLTVNNSSTGDTSATVCDSLVWYGTPYYTSGDYSHVISNVAGCDSTITLHLTVNNSSTGDTSATVCDSLVWYGTPYYTTGDYPHVISNVAGCDSTITLHLTVNNSTTASINPTACFTYTSPSGKIWNSSGNYMDTIPNLSGCDSLISINLTINTVDTSVTKTSSIILTANATGAAYQWLDCNNAFALLCGETSQSFTATVNGLYAVEVTENGCTDTSSCYTINGVGIEEQRQSNILVYPNPNKGVFVVENIEDYRLLRITNMIGDEVFSKEIKANSIEIDIATLPKGIYLLHCIAKEQRVTQKIIIQ